MHRSRSRNQHAHTSHIAQRAMSPPRDPLLRSECIGAAMDMLTHADEFIGKYDVKIPSESTSTSSTSSTNASKGDVQEGLHLSAAERKKRQETLALLRDDPLAAMKYGTGTILPSTLTTSISSAQRVPSTGNTKASSQAVPRSVAQGTTTGVSSTGTGMGASTRTSGVTQLNVIQRSVVGGLSVDDPLNQLLPDDGFGVTLGLDVGRALKTDEGMIREEEVVLRGGKDKERDVRSSDNRQRTAYQMEGKRRENEQDGMGLSAVSLSRILQVNMRSCEDAMRVAVQIQRQRLKDEMQKRKEEARERKDIAKEREEQDEAIDESYSGTGSAAGRGADASMLPTLLPTIPSTDVMATMTDTTMTNFTKNICQSIAPTNNLPKDAEKVGDPSLLFTSSDIVRAECKKNDEISVYDLSFGELMFLTTINRRGLRYLVEMMGGDAKAGDSYWEIYNSWENEPFSELDVDEDDQDQDRCRERGKENERKRTREYGRAGVRRVRQEEQEWQQKKRKTSQEDLVGEQIQPRTYTRTRTQMQVNVQAQSSVAQNEPVEDVFMEAPPLLEE